MNQTDGTREAGRQEPTNRAQLPYEEFPEVLCGQLYPLLTVG